MINFIAIEYGSAAFDRECELRHQVLRVPLGLSLFEEDLWEEKRQMHFGLFEGEGLVACVIAVAIGPGKAKIRQMAVIPGQQGKGYGRRLLQCLESELGKKGISYFCLHARMSAVGFYEKLNYSRVGEQFTEVGLAHIKMEKCLSAGE